MQSNDTPTNISLNCDRFQSLLSTVMQQSEINVHDQAAILLHLRSCKKCQAKFGMLLEGVWFSVEDTLTCTECEDLLPEYLMSRRRDTIDTTHWQTIQNHLRICPSCHNILSELQTLESELEMMEEVIPTTSNLINPVSVSQAPESQSISAEIKWRVDELGAIIIELSKKFVASFDVPVFAGVKGETTRKILCKLDLPEVFEDCAVTIIAQEMFQDATHCEISIDVRMPSRGGWPNLAGIEVMVKRGEHMLQKQLTDSFGKAYFSGIRRDELDQLVVQIYPHS